MIFKRALTIFSYGLPEYELKDDGKGTIALTLLRCVGLLAAEGLITRPGGKSGWHNETPGAQCPGKHTFRYAVLPHRAGDTGSASLINMEAERFHLPLLSFRRKDLRAAAPASAFAVTGSSALTFSALKEAEDGGALIFRVYNTGGSPVNDVVTFGCSIVRAWKSSLDEREVERLEVKDGSTIPLHLKAGEILTVRAELPGWEKRVKNDSGGRNR